MLDSLTFKTPGGKFFKPLNYKDGSNMLFILQSVLLALRGCFVAALLGGHRSSMARCLEDDPFSMGSNKKLVYSCRQTFFLHGKYMKIWKIMEGAISLGISSTEWYSLSH